MENKPAGAGGDGADRPERRVGTSPLHGRPVDENGQIAFDPPADPPLPLTDADRRLLRTLRITAD